MKNPHLINLSKIELVLTNACTGSCKHCQRGTQGSALRLDPKVSVDLVRKTCREYEIGTVMTFGGEPLLYKQAVYMIMRAATECGVATRQVITNGYFSSSQGEIRECAEELYRCGVNDLLLSVDAFHQQSIPLETVMLFATEAIRAGLPLRLQPAWLVSPESDNPYNRKTREILDAFRGTGAAVGCGNVVFPEGNARIYLSEYFEAGAPENPYAEDPYDVRCLSVEADGGVLGGNIYETDITDILSAYTPK